MSLINDALKRAKLAQQPLLPTQPVVVPVQPAKVVELIPGPSLSFPKLSLLVVVLLGVVIGLQWLFTASRRAEAASKMKNTHSVQTAVATFSPPAPAPAITPEPAPEATQSEPVRVAAFPATGHHQQEEETSKTTFQPAEQGTPEPTPALKLQGIIYHPARPSAMIDGRTVFIGDRVNDLKVLRITSQSVSLQGPAGTTVLRLR